jgi:hypothetical protein
LGPLKRPKADKQFERKKMLKNVSIIASIVLASLLLVAVSGCVNNHSSISYQPQDPAIGKAALNEVKVGKTTKDELTSLFGASSAQSSSPDGTEILRYNYGKKTSGHFCVAPFVDLYEDKDERMTICFELKNNIVTKYWREP